MWFIIGALVVVFIMLFCSMPAYKSVFDILKDNGVDSGRISSHYKNTHTITTTGGALLLLAMFVLVIVICILITLQVVT